jgi:hypothetical protein
MFAKPKAVKLMDGTPLSNLLTANTNPTTTTKTTVTKNPVPQQKTSNPTTGATQKAPIGNKKAP